MSINPRYFIREKLVDTHPILAETPLGRDSEGKIHQNLNDRFNELFKLNVFNEHELGKRVPGDVIEKYQNSLDKGELLDPSTANVIATAIKEWALKRGATHYTHWFQPLRRGAAEKHDAFLDFNGHLGDLRMEFTGSALLRGEPDGSSFPGGGLRATYKARGYTAWDPSSPPFIMEGKNGNTLYIPTCFLSWTGEALDHKTPLLRSVRSLSKECVELLNLIGETSVTSVHVNMGPEQEFFVIDAQYYHARPDLITSGRTVLGAQPCKGQQLEDHYFGTIPPRILTLLQETEIELWKLGVPTKTRHNEVAPGQHEMAPIFEEVNLANDHNVLLMVVLKAVAKRQGLAALLHEKPFAGVNGSGKHNNWSLGTNTGINLLNPGATPYHNKLFLIFLTCVIKAVDDHADLLRCSIATSGQDFRLGAQEAPPAIMSVYLGDVLDELVHLLISEYDDPEEKVEEKAKKNRPTLASIGQQASVLDLGHGLTPLRRDKTDRNRTSPFAFTGNKFEFRAPGSSSEIAFTGMVMNAITAAAVRDVTAILRDAIAANEKAGQSKKDAIDNAVHTQIRRLLKKHNRVVFNGNGYAQSWVEEAARRGLLNNADSVSALKYWNTPKNAELFSSLGILSPAEVQARSNVLFDAWSHETFIEADVLENLVTTQVLPAGYKQQTQQAASLAALKAALPEHNAAAQLQELKNLTETIDHLVESNLKLREVVAECKVAEHESEEQHAIFIRDEVVPLTRVVRRYADKLERLVEDSLWTLPKYQEMLFIK